MFWLILSIIFALICGYIIGFHVGAKVQNYADKQTVLNILDKSLDIILKHPELKTNKLFSNAVSYVCNLTHDALLKDFYNKKPIDNL